MVYVESPNKLHKKLDEFCIRHSLFLAGGVSNCSDWQKEVVSRISDLDVIVFNPRRISFDTTNSEVEKEQILWEFEMLHKASYISFYFCEETVCPITLYELGTWSRSNKELIIAMDENYSRRRDVEIQISLIRPELKIFYGLNELIKEIRSHFKVYKSDF
jgi:Nucleoside 2-deoxyribosyltransferase like